MNYKKLLRARKGSHNDSYRFLVYFQLVTWWTWLQSLSLFWTGADPALLKGGAIFFFKEGAMGHGPPIRFIILGIF